MNHLLSILLTAILCATASAQTIKPLSYNASNNAVIAATNTNALAFNNNIRVFDTLIQDAEISWSGVGIINFEERRFRGGGWTFDEAPGFDDVPGTRASLGLGYDQNVEFARIKLGYGQAQEFGYLVTGEGLFGYSTDTNTAYTNLIADLGAGLSSVVLYKPLEFNNSTNRRATMRALSGSTNTNEPYSGSISVVGTNNTNTLVFSNGILQSVQ